MTGVQQVLHRMMEADSPADAEPVMSASHRAPSTYPFPVEQLSVCRLTFSKRLLTSMDHPARSGWLSLVSFDN